MSELDLNKVVVLKNSNIMYTKNTARTPFNTIQGKDFDNAWLI